MGSGEMHSVFIGNLSDHARHEDIEKFFKGYGSLRDISLKGGYGKNCFCSTPFYKCK